MLASWLKNDMYLDLSCLCPWWHFTTLLNTAVKMTTWSFGAKKKNNNNKSKTFKWVCAPLRHTNSILAY